MTAEAKRIFREIYEENAGRIYGYIFRKIGDAASAADLKQDVFIALLFNMSNFLSEYPQNTTRIKAWLFGVADNKIRLYWRNNQKRLDAEVSLEQLDEFEDLRADFSEAEFMLPKWLDQKDKEILSLRLSGYTLKEIAGKLGISYEACRQRNSRVTRDLKKYFKK